MKKILLLICFSLLAHSSVLAEYQYSFSTVSVNYLNWSNKTEVRSNDTKKDFFYLELEGGAGFSWGDIYGFVDFENPSKSVDESPAHNRTAMKGIVQVNMGSSKFNYFGQIYNYTEKSFTDQNMVLGVSYDVTLGKSFWAKPFIGRHMQNAVGENGYMLGWSMSYHFNLLNKELHLFNWHEFEFNRDPSYGENGFNGKKSGHNGALSLWMDLNKTYVVGLQYRYANYKLGTAAFQDAVIYSLKINL